MNEVCSVGGGADFVVLGINDTQKQKTKAKLNKNLTIFI
jgi:hypothetical protein